MMKGEAQKGAPPSKLSVGRVASARAGGSVGRGGGGRAAGVATRRTSAMEDRVPGLSAVAEEVVGLQTTPLVPTKGVVRRMSQLRWLRNPMSSQKGDLWELMWLRQQRPRSKLWAMRRCLTLLSH